MDTSVDAESVQVGSGLLTFEDMSGGFCILKYSEAGFTFPYSVRSLIVGFLRIHRLKKSGLGSEFLCMEVGFE